MNRAVWLVVLAVLFPALVFAAGGDMGTVRGKIASPDQKPCRGVVSLWDGSEGRTPDPRRYLIIPFSAVNLRPSCEFELPAGAGSYYVGALLRQLPALNVAPVTTAWPVRSNVPAVIRRQPGQPMCAPITTTC